MFKKIRDYDYEVSDDGQVRNMKTGQILKSNIRKDGHLQVGLYKNKKRKTYKIHRLVLETFIGPCPKGMEGCHNNGNPKDNRVENLRWDTRKNNSQDSIKHGTHFKPPIFNGSKNSQAKLNEEQIKKIRDRYIRYSKDSNSVTLAKEFGVSQQEISRVVNNKLWKHVEEKKNG